MPREIGHREQQVAEFLLDMGRIAALRRLVQLCNFFLYLVENMRCFRPVKPHPRGALLQFDRAQQRRQPQRHPVERAGLLARGALCGLHRLPVAGLLLGAFLTVFVAEDMGMARHHLVGNGVGDIVNVK